MISLRRIVRRVGSRIDAARGLKSRDPFVVTQHLMTAHRPVIFDIGAHIGQTMARYRSRFPDALIHCFEPFPASFDQLAAAAADDPNVRLHRIALSDSSGERTLNINASSATNSLLASDKRAAYYWGGNLLDTHDQIAITTDTLDSVRSRELIEHIDILKIDVQGAEYAVLEGAYDSLQRQSIDMLYMELIMAPTYVGQQKLHEYLSFLDARGYALFNFYNGAYRNGRLIQADAIFLSSRFLAQFESSASATMKNAPPA